MSPSSNQSLANSTLIRPTLDELLDSFGQTWVINYLWFYPITITSVFGTITNILSIFILHNPEFNTKLYEYLKIYCINSAQVCFFSMFVVYPNSFRIFSWGNAFATHVYWSWVYLPFVVTGYLFGTLLDCFIILDRIATFERKAKVFFKYSPLKMAVIALGVSIAIQFPWFFEFIPASTTVTLETGIEYQIWYLGLSNYASTETGQIILFIIYGIRDIATMVIVIILNIVSIVYFKAYLNAKFKLLNKPKPHVTLTLASTARVAPTSAIPTERVDTTQMNARAQKPAREMDQISSSEQKATIMCLVMCVITILEHFIHITCNVVPILSDSNFKFFLFWAASMVFVLKHSLNFVLFMAFNKVFNKVCYKMLKF